MSIYRDNVRMSVYTVLGKHRNSYVGSDFCVNYRITAGQYRTILVLFLGGHLNLHFKELEKVEYSGFKAYFHTIYK